MNQQKNNLNTHDVYALVTELQYLVGSQVVNIYDIDSQKICIKLRCKNETNKQIIELDTKNDEKKHILKYLFIDSSMKFYIIDDFKAVNDIPSSFSTKMRKHLREKRISSFTQVNCDRVIDIKFGMDDKEKGFEAFHIIAEFYASGNIILTDGNYMILHLIHPYVYKKENMDIKTRVSTGNVYPFDLATSKINLTLQNFKNFLSEEIKNNDMSKKIKIKQLVVKLPLIAYGPTVLEHALIVSNIQPNIKIDNMTNIFDIFTDEKINNIISSINELFKLTNFNGYLIKSIFIPFLYEQYKNTQNNEIVQFDTFSNAVKVHFGKIDKFETKEIKANILKKEKISKNDKIIVNIENQINGLSEKIEKNDTKIENIKEYANILQQFIDDIKNGIHNNNNKIFLIEYTKHLSLIKFNFNNIEYIWNTQISTYANLNNIYNTNKYIKEKIIKAEIALSNVKKTQHITNNENHNMNIQVILKGKINEFWFEKYNWFITSDNLLFVCGKTADQNEQLVKNHFNDDDLYFHSEVFGSGSGILKHNSDNKVIIERDCCKSIEESGNFLICHTHSWKTSTPERTYWVYKHQVSKTPESGEYIQKGSFIIRDKKNYIPIQKMELGLGILFKTSNNNNLVTNGNDNIEYALPIVATYSTLKNYKFKIKITPGSQKIGKLLQQVINNFYKIANIYEKEGIKKISNDEMHRVLVTGVKFHL